MAAPATRRRQVIALMLSGIFPGIGQLYNRQPIKGAVGVVLGVVLTWAAAARAAPADPLALSAPAADIPAPLFALLAVWVWSLVDAWRSCRPLRPGGSARESLPEARSDLLRVESNRGERLLERDAPADVRLHDDPRQAQLVS